MRLEVGKAGSHPLTETGRRIQALRRAAGIPRQEVARRLNFDYARYLGIEKGTILPAEEEVRAIAAFFGVGGEQVGGEESAPPESAPGDPSGALRRLVIRQKALLELLIEKGIFEESEFEEAYRDAGKGS